MKFKLFNRFLFFSITFLRAWVCVCGCIDLFKVFFSPQQWMASLWKPESFLIQITESIYLLWIHSSRSLNEMRKKNEEFFINWNNRIFFLSFFSCLFNSFLPHMFIFFLFFISESHFISKNWTMKLVNLVLRNAKKKFMQNKWINKLSEIIMDCWSFFFFFFSLFFLIHFL